MRGYLIILAAFLTMALSTVAHASGRLGDIHEYCGESTAIVIGSPVSFSAKEPSAELKVERWIKTPPATTQPSTLPATLHLTGGPGRFEGQAFHELASKGRFLIFIFPGNRTGDGRLGTILPIDEHGQLPASLYLRCLDPQPKTEGDLIAQINRVRSREYQAEQISLLTNQDAHDPDRAAAARHLGALYARDAWSVLASQSTMPGTDETQATTRESLLALFRIDEAKTTPICLSIVQNSRHEDQVDTAAWLLSRRPSDDPKSLDILLAAAQRWETGSRYPADRPLPSLIQALIVMDKRTPEFEALIMRNLEKGRGNVLVTSMEAAAHFKIRRAVPFIYEALKSSDKVFNLKSSASVAIAILVGDDIHPYTVNRAMTDDQARQSAAEAFPAWQNAIAKAPTADCFRGDKVLCATIDGGSIYILIAWQQQPDQPQPYRKSILLHSTVPAAGAITP